MVSEIHANGTEKERFSFSKLNSFHTCPYMYKQTYIDHKKGINNCFASYGTEVHSIMERYAKGELQLSKLAEVYQFEFDTNIPEQFPYSSFCKDEHGKKISMRELYYQQGLNYLKNFQGYEGKKILGVEQELEYDVDDWIFNGFMDLLYEDEQGKLILLDYKSKSSFKSKKEQREYARQLYLYAYYVNKALGKYPDVLRFWMFRKNIIVDIPFNINDMNEAMIWARDTVKLIRSSWFYESNPNEFFCEQLCNHREYCDQKK